MIIISKYNLCTWKHLKESRDKKGELLGPGKTERPTGRRVLFFLAMT